MKEEEVYKELLIFGYSEKEANACIQRERDIRAKAEEVRKEGIINRLLRDMD